MKTFKQLKLELKTELKQLAKSIHDLKPLRKGAPNGVVNGLGAKQWEFRSKHIDYCMFRGTPYELIERSHRDVHEYSHKYCKQQADQLLTMYNSQLEAQNEQNVCDNQTRSE